MTSKEAKMLLIGTVVFWKNDRSDLGTVRRLSPYGFYVDWESGMSGWINYHAARYVIIY